MTPHSNFFMKIQVFWDAMLCCGASSWPRFEG